MSRASQAANSVLKAVEDVCALYRIPCFRMQSRVFTVAGKGGKPRPMFSGQWTDDLGVLHSSGMADLLLTPRLAMFKGTLVDGSPIPDEPYIYTKNLVATSHSVPLWVECKSGKGELTDKQQAFRCYVQSNGMYFLECHDSADALIEWLKSHGVTR